MKSIIVIGILLLNFIEAYARVGMGEIQFKTPGGHVICDCDPYSETPVLIGFESSIKNLKEWYFYKNHIIGFGKNYYFIFNETTNQPQLFQDKETWRQAIAQQQLKPFFTRWLDISDSIEARYTIIVLGMFIWIPIVLIIGIGSFIFFYVTGFNKRRAIAGVLTLFTIAVVMLYLINVHSF
ncbi:hypothetical protein ACFQ21_01385 [Ohtaekwangia kribbensis]|uniref:Uncharacterized protein n=1 Tax=Ohtaekwangia kribbensis TaxID=688913 RepID=A0ABW3JWM3_9BACT